MVPIAGKVKSNHYSQCIRFAHGLGPARGLGPAHGASFSMAIAKIGNAELAHINKQMLIHELIRGSLSYKLYSVKRWNTSEWLYIFA
jgi:hypothetical protein